MDGATSQSPVTQSEVNEELDRLEKISISIEQQVKNLVENMQGTRGDRPELEQAEPDHPSGLYPLMQSRLRRCNARLNRTSNIVEGLLGMTYDDRPETSAPA